MVVETLLLMLIMTIFRSMCALLSNILNLLYKTTLDCRQGKCLAMIYFSLDPLILPYRLAGEHLINGL